MRETIYAMSDLAPSDPAKAAVARKKIDAALDEALKPSKDLQALQASTDKLCKDMDEILAELRAPAPAR